MPPAMVPGWIAAASGVLIDLSSARLAPEDELLAAARSLDLDLTERGSTTRYTSALAWVLGGGEDHALAATFSPRTELPPRWTVIGEVGQGQGVLVDGQSWTGSAGWDHFAVLARRGDDPPHPKER